MTVYGIEGDFTVCDTAMLNRFFRDYFREHGQGGTPSQQRNEGSRRSCQGRVRARGPASHSSCGSRCRLTSARPPVAPVVGISRVLPRDHRTAAMMSRHDPFGLKMVIPNG